MAQHGYLGDDYGSNFDPDYDANDERDRSWRGDQQRHRWRDRDDDRRFMLDRDDRGRSWGDGEREGSGTFSRMTERAREWFSDDDDRERGHYRGRSDSDEWFGGRGAQRQRPSGYGSQGQYSQQRGPSAHPDDHYRSWRDKQMQALDREYADYCREREQQFHSEFENWRQKRLQSATTGQGGSADQPMELTNPTRLSGEVVSTPNPMSEATAGTNNPENSATGRRRR